MKPDATDDLDVARIRRRLLMSQSSFARRYGLSLPTLRNWERRSRSPDAAARAYLTVIARDPERVAAAFAGATREGLMRLSLNELRAALDAADAAAAPEAPAGKGGLRRARRSPARSRPRAAGPRPSPAAPAASRSPDR
jgi:transcriptional regulator with XRE-family HTH domain